MMIDRIMHFKFHKVFQVANILKYPVGLASVSDDLQYGSKFKTRVDSCSSPLSIWTITPILFCHLAMLARTNWSCRPENH